MQELLALMTREFCPHKVSHTLFKVKSVDIYSSVVPVTRA